MILLVDNYDSFVFNLGRYLRRLGQETVVLRNDAVDPAEVRRLEPAAIVLSPGPCTPREAGASLALVREFSASTPILGICLGHQTIAEALGGAIVRAKVPMHGRSSHIEHDGRGVFAGVANPFTVGRYHSLVVDPDGVPDCLEVSAWSDDGEIMAFRHRQAPVVGLQFHPESILSEQGYPLLANFLRLAGLDPEPPPAMTSELSAPPEDAPLPDQPVTF
jgi:anthranilate synthase/aminodeoxychorismate synthase-like glutamine amidotransferase